MLEALIERAIKAKQGNKEFALFHYGEGQWQAEIGNSSRWVRLGEISGDFYSEICNSPEKAVEDLIRKIPT